MTEPFLVVEGAVDEMVMRTVLASRQIVPRQVIITGGKNQLDVRLPTYNRAARHQPWIVLRDGDHDASGCPVILRSRLLGPHQDARMCLRIAIRTVESWMLADRDRFAEFFGVITARVPTSPEQLDSPKNAVVNTCRRSRRREIRSGMTPPEGSSGVGPEYTRLMSEFAEHYWRPDIAASAAESLERTLREIDRLVSTGTW